MILKSIFVLCSLIVYCYAKPGAPQIKWGTHKYSLVELNEQAVSYNNLIVANRDSVTVNLEWDVWSGTKGTSVQLLANGVVVKNGTAQDLQSQKIGYKTNEGGNFEAAIRLCDDSECSDSASVVVSVADTDGSHLNPIKYMWSENNVPFEKITDNVVGAYFVEWGVYDRQYPADKIPIPNLTHLLYGFIPICGGDGVNDALKQQIPSSFEALQKSCAGRKDFKVTIHDIWGALQKPQKGVEAYNEPYKGNFGQLMAIKRHNPDLTILPSIGGWTLSDPFYQLNDVEKRNTFVDSVREFLETWKFFDGVDIDWEFPGGKGANPSLGNASVDRKTYTILLKELREMLNKLEKKRGKRLQLTSAIGAGYDKIDVVDYTDAQRYLDYIFVMTYDFKGAWSMENLGFQTPLYAPSWDVNENYTTHFAINRLLNQNVDSTKLVVGVAMYGRGWSGVHRVENNNPFTGIASAPVKGTWESGVIDYKDIVNRYDESVQFYDNIAQSPYVYDNNDLVTYDNDQSVVAKGKYVVSKNLGGLFAWEIDADNGDLLNAMNTGLGNIKKYDGPLLKSINYKKYVCPLKTAIVYAINAMCK
nr:chitinase [Pieris rapae granulovirus]